MSGEREYRLKISDGFLAAIVDDSVYLLVKTGALIDRADLQLR